MYSSRVFLVPLSLKAPNTTPATSVERRRGTVYSSAKPALGCAAACAVVGNMYANGHKVANSTACFSQVSGPVCNLDAVDCTLSCFLSGMIERHRAAVGLLVRRAATVMAFELPRTDAPKDCVTFILTRPAICPPVSAYFFDHFVRGCIPTPRIPPSESLIQRVAKSGSTSTCTSMPPF